MMATVLATVIAVQYVLLASIVYNAVRGFASSAKDFANAITRNKSGYMISGFLATMLRRGQ